MVWSAKQTGDSKLEVQLRVRKDYHPRDACSKTIPITEILSFKIDNNAFIYPFS